MADRVVLVNGLPASGKTTLATALAEQLGWVLLSKDAILTPLASLVGPRVSSETLGGLALDTMYSLAAAVEGGVILDAIWLSTRDRPFLEQGLAIIGAPRVIEVWCSIPQPLAHERFERRRPQRHPVHGAWRPGFWDDAVPITHNPLVVNTADEVDVADLTDRVARALAG